MPRWYVHSSIADCTLTSRLCDPNNIPVNAVMPVEILVVEDNQSDAVLIKNALMEFLPGVRVTVAKDANIAVVLLFDSGFRPQLVITDMNMPTGGIEEVLHRAEAKRVPVVVFSSALSPCEVAEVLALGAREYIPKPKGWDDFRDAVVGIVTRWTRHPA